MNKILAATALVAGLLGTANAAHANPVRGYENYMSNSWGRTDHSFTPDGSHAGLLKVRLADQASDGDCVYVTATVRVNYGPDYSRHIGRVCGSGSVDAFTHRFNPVAGTRVRGVDVTMCRDRNLLPDVCVTEYNAR